MIDSKRTNLCSVCRYIIPTCGAVDIQFGTAGLDNVIACDTFEYTIRDTRYPQNEQDENRALLQDEEGKPE